MHYFKKVFASIKLFLNLHYCLLVVQITIIIILFITRYRRGIYPSNSENLTTKEIFYFLVYITRNEYEKYSYIYLLFYIYAFFKKILFSILSIKDYHIPFIICLYSQSHKSFNILSGTSFLICLRAMSLPSVA